LILFFSRLSKNFIPKKKEDDEYQFTATKAFKLMLNEINDLAGELQAATSFVDPERGSGDFFDPWIRGKFFRIIDPTISESLVANNCCRSTRIFF
jgi:hypothetical protein